MRSDFFWPFPSSNRQQLAVAIAVEKYGWIRVVTSGYISDKSG